MSTDNTILNLLNDLGKKMLSTESIGTSHKYTDGSVAYSITWDFYRPNRPACMEFWSAVFIKANALGYRYTEVTVDDKGRAGFIFTKQ